jgi:hypothetical protein
MKYDVKNITSGVRSFPGGGRYLTLAGGETERAVELSTAEADALKATREFAVKEIPGPAPVAPTPVAKTEAPEVKATK